MSTKLSRHVRSLSRQRRLGLLFPAMAAVSLGLIFACAGELPADLKGATGTGGAGTGGTQQTGCDHADQVLSSNCAACHTTASSAFGNLDLISADVGSRLVGVASKGPASPSGCMGKGDLLESGSSPATGILIQKIKKMQTCGTEMPPGSTLAQDDIACLQAWANGLVAGSN